MMIEGISATIQQIVAQNKIKEGKKQGKNPQKRSNARPGSISRTLKGDKNG